MSELKIQIEQALKRFSSSTTRDCAVNLLNVLGYGSDKTDDIEPNTFQGFKEYFLSGELPFSELNAKTDEWQSIDILFQLTDEELKKQNGLFSGGKLDNRIIESYLFLAIQLKGSDYNRTDLARIVREINQVTPMPSMLLLRYGDKLTIAAIDRRLHKRDASKDVLEKKVTFIKDISVTEPIRAHIEILHDLALSSLVQRYKVDTFVALHNAWRKTLDISALNRRFYKELFNWYLYAVKSVTFPNPDKLAVDVNNSINVIRLLTRLIFCWFIKEKGLIPWRLFHQEHLKDILSDRASADSSAFYKAILQNLFFATLNTEMNRDNPDSRRFITEDKVNGVNPDYNNFTVYRHKNLFKDPEAALKLFADVPFLNGGLFECLDTVEIRL
jgi:adenine-specific DNA-methyltransferase